MRDPIIGSGYVDTTIAGCFADLGHDVVNIDIDQEIVDTINAGTAPTHGDGFSGLIAEYAGPNSTGQLTATTDYEAVLDTDMTFRCLSTPQNAAGSLNLSNMDSHVNVTGKRVAVLVMSFNPGAGDIRNSHSHPQA